MNILMKVLKVVLIVLLVLTNFGWFIMHGSSHKIPLDTDLSFAVLDLSLASLIIFFYYLGRNKR